MIGQIPTIQRTPYDIVICAMQNVQILVNNLLGARFILGDHDKDGFVLSFDVHGQVYVDLISAFSERTH